MTNKEVSSKKTILVKKSASSAAKLLRPNYCSVQVSADCCKECWKSVAVDEFNLQAGKVSAHCSCTSYEQKAFINNCKLPVQVMNIQKQRRTSPSREHPQPQPYLEPLVTRAEQVNLQRQVFDPSRRASHNSIVPPPRVLQQAASQQRKARSASDLGEYCSGQKSELAYLIVNLQADPQDKHVSGSTGFNTDEQEEGSDMSLTGLREKFRKKTKKPKTPRVSREPSFKRNGEDFSISEGHEDGGNTVEGVVDASSSSSGVVSREEAMGDASRDVTRRVNSVVEFSLGSSPDSDHGGVAMNPSSAKSNGASAVADSDSETEHSYVNTLPGIGSLKSQVSQDDSNSPCRDNPSPPTVDPPTVTDSTTESNNSSPAVEDVPTSSETPSQTSDSLAPTFTSKRRHSEDFNGGNLGLPLASSYPTAPLKAKLPKCPSEAGRDTTSTAGMGHSSVGTRDSEDIGMFARSKTISVIPSGVNSAREVDSVRAAVQRAKERRKKPAKPLPYNSKKTTTDAATSAQIKSSVQPTKSTSPPVAPAKPVVSPKKSLPLPPRNVNRPTWSPGRLPAKTEPPPAVPPPRFPPTSQLVATEDTTRTVSSCPQQRRMPPRPPVPSSSTPTMGSHTKKRLSWGSNRHLQAIYHSSPKPPSHSNPSTLTRGLPSTPTQGSLRGNVSISGPLLRSATCVSIQRSTPIPSTTTTGKPGSEGAPVYEEISDWVMPKSSPPQATTAYSLRSRYNLQTRSVSCEGAGPDDAGSDVDEYVDMQGFLGTTDSVDQDEGDDDEAEYVDMQPFKPDEVDSEELNQDRQESEIYVEMKPASLYPAPETPPPIYAPIMPSPLANSKQPKQKWEEPSSNSLYYASSDLLAKRR